MSEIRKLKPEPLWNYFADICEIPHPSKKEGRMVEFVKKFGESLGLETIVDAVGNVIIRKPATPGFEDRKGVVLQAHLDMVPQKNSDKKHDFEKDPIVPMVDGEWVTADGTTLGADNGMGVAAAMSVLASKDLKHGMVEGLFTVDEETGMTGAFALKGGILKGHILMNLDSEDEGELYVGCAGGVDVSAKMSYKGEKMPAGHVAYKIMARGMKGGHSGIDIPLGRANANKIIFRFLTHAEADLNIRLAEAEAGDLRNAIPREGFAVITVASDKAAGFEKLVKEYNVMYKAEFGETEPDISFTCEKTKEPVNVLPEEAQYRIVRAVFACPNGVQRMSTSMAGLVETSNNLAIVKVGNGSFEAYCLTRGSVDTAKIATAWKIAAVFQLAGAEVGMAGEYPGWKPNMNSPILKTMQGVYNNMYGKVPEIKAIHAGLECGILGGNYPNLDMISFGPTIRYPHSPDEKVNIATVQKFYDFLVETLENIPKK